MYMVIVPDRLAAVKPDFIGSQVKSGFKVWLNEYFSNAGLFCPKLHQCACSFAVEGEMLFVFLRNHLGE